MTSLIAQAVVALWSELVGWFRKEGFAPDVAEDCAQQTCERALKSAAAFRGDCTPRTWLYEIAHCVRADHLKGRYQGTKPPDDKPMLGHNGWPPFDDGAPHTGCEPGKLRFHEVCYSEEQHAFEREIELRERSQAWERLKPALTPDERRSAELLAEGFTPGEVAAQLGLTPRKVYALRASTVEKAHNFFDGEETL